MRGLDAAVMREGSVPRLSSTPITSSESRGLASFDLPHPTLLVARGTLDVGEGETAHNERNLKIKRASTDKGQEEVQRRRLPAMPSRVLISFGQVGHPSVLHHSTHGQQGALLAENAGTVAPRRGKGRFKGSKNKLKASRAAQPVVDLPPAKRRRPKGSKKPERLAELEVSEMVSKP